jgi:hypothetical protein
MGIETGALNYKHVNANGTTVVNAGACLLQAVIINSKGVSSNTVTVYDNTAGSGTVVAVIDTTSQVVTLTFSAQMGTGLTIVMATGTAADITVVWE